MNRHYEIVARRAGHRCEYCRAPEAIFNLPFEVEHIEPSSKGGLDDESNLALSCRACNLFKSNQQSALDEATGEVERLFHPRIDRWEDHFLLQDEAGRLTGLTRIGRATVSCLRLNRDAQCEARRAWVRLGIYPA
jgi:hypothetical protein